MPTAFGDRTDGCVRLLALVAIPAAALILVSCGDEPNDAQEGTSDTVSAPADVAACTCDASKDTPCLRNRCQPDRSCKMVPEPKGVPCSDGKPCTIGDACDAGKCAAGSFSACECQETTDCKDDGDKCNGAVFCDKAILPWRCRTKPGTAVTCSSGDALCQVAACDPKTGKCTTTNRPDTTPCDDGDKCTKNDACKVGKDGKSACTGLQTCSCKTTADCAAVDDGNPCNGVHFCDTKKGKCEVNAASIITCPAGKAGPCIVNACNESTGLCGPKPAKMGTTCDDDDKCTSGDRCNAGVCAPGTNACLCKKDADCEKHDDGNKCNGLQFCEQKSGTCKPNPASLVTCQSVKDSDCAHNVCQPGTGKCAMRPRAEVTFVCTDTLDAKGKPTKACKWRMKLPGDAIDKGPYICDDGDSCTSGEACKGMTCKASAVTCKCKSNADCEGKDDGNLCNGTWYCDKSLKVAACVFNKASVVFCKKSDDSACLKAQCDPKTGKCGLQPVKAGAKCVGDACKLTATCDGKGSCAGTAKKCDDGNECTQDSCDPKSGCVHAAKMCNDGNACTADTCDKKKGTCSFSAGAMEAKICNADSDACTVNDTCTKGLCTAGTKAVCKMKLAPCEAAQCVGTGANSFKCIAVAKKDGAPCEDADPCTFGSMCKAGQCGKGTKQKLFHRILNTGFGRTEFYAVARSSLGKLLWGGVRYAKDGKSFTGFVYETDDRGHGTGQTATWTNYTSTEDHGRVTDVAVDALGHWVVVLNGTPKGQQRRLVIERRHGTSFKGLSQALLGPKDSKMTGHAVAALSDGSLVVVGTHHPKTSSKWAPYIALVDKNQTVTWEIASKPGMKASYRDVAVDADGTIVAAGTHRTGTGYNSVGLLRFHATSGKVTKAVTFLAGGQWNDVVAVKSHPKGGHVVAGTASGSGIAGGFVARLNAGGAVTWQRKFPLEVFPSDLHVDDNGFIATTTTKKLKSGSAVAGMAILDTFGNAIRTPAYASIHDGALGGMTALPDGSMALAGGLLLSGTRRAQMMRVDTWGHQSCSESGGCLDLPPNKCDDGNPCTIDVCIGTKGCKHVAAEGIACAAPNSCSLEGRCTKGKCVHGKLARLYRNSAPTSLATLVATVSTGGDDQTVIGTTSAGRLRVVRADAYGKLYFDAPVGNVVHDKILDAHALQGGLVVIGQLKGSKDLTMYGVTDTHKVVWAEKTCDSKLHTCANAFLYERGLSAMRSVVSLIGKSGPTLRVIRLNTGTPKTPIVSSVDVPFTMKYQYLYAMNALRTSDDGSFICGAAPTYSNGPKTVRPAGFVARLDANNKPVYAKLYGGSNHFSALTHCAAMTHTTGFIAVGEFKKTATSTTGIDVRHISLSGKELYRSEISDGGTYAVMGLATRADGLNLLTLMRAASSGQAPSLQILGLRADLRKTVWKRSLPGLPGQAYLNRRAANLNDRGGVNLVARRVIAGKTMLDLVRTDRWGYWDCGDAGKCAGASLKTCVDGKTCTLDLCDASGGCNYQPLSEKCSE